VARTAGTPTDEETPMTLHTLFRALRRTLLTGLAVAGSLAQAQAWTDKPVKVIIPAPSGGSIDVVGRLFAEQLQADTGITAIMDYKPGAGGAIAVQALRSAPADGLTLMLTSSNVLVEIPHVMKTSFDPLKDVKPIATVARGAVVLVANPQVPATDVAGFVNYAKANPGKLSFASYSAGTASHYAGLILNQKAGLDLQHIPFPGSPPALVQVMGGQIPLMFDGMATSLPQIRAGKLKALGVASTARSVHLPQVPTLAEQGYGEVTYGGWFGFIASSAMPDDLIAKINAAIVKSAAVPRLAEKLAAAGLEPNVAMTPAQMGQLIRSDFDRNLATVKAFDIKLAQ
jgi:tripartite-type tricarboxylate transporter receptor subunit TctC